jgi:hypothetical protein
MVTIKYKGHRSSGHRTDGGRVITFNPGEVHTFDEKNKRYRDFVKRMLAQPDIFEIQDKVGAKGIGGGVRTRSRRSKHRGRPSKAKEEIKPPKSVIDKIKKPRGLRRPKRKTK